MAEISYKVNEPFDLIALQTAAHLILGGEAVFINEYGLHALAICMASAIGAKKAFPENAINDDYEDGIDFAYLENAADKFEAIAGYVRKEIARRNALIEPIADE